MTAADIQYSSPYEDSVPLRIAATERPTPGLPGPTGIRGIAAPRRTNPGARLTYIYAPVVHAVARIPRAGELRPLRNIAH